MLQETKIGFIRIPNLAELFNFNHAFTGLELFNNIKEVDSEEFLILLIEGFLILQSKLLGRTKVKNNTELREYYSWAFLNY
jgi:hypothetical protein